VKGLLAAGECDYQYHGANRLGANSLLSCIYGGELAAKTAMQYVSGLEGASDGVPGRLFEEEVKRQESANDEIIRARGKESPYLLWEEMAKWMTDHVTVIRANEKLKETDAKLVELTERLKHVNINDMSTWANQPLIFTRELGNMLALARVIALGALHRNESRGAHYKPAFPDRNDKAWLKTTIAKWGADAPQFSYETVDTSLMEPRERKY
jgi:succinate dehydrogenase / fumarate reductase flavoprotein subunit